MRSVRISESFVPISEFKAQAQDLLRKLGETGAPLVVTQNGRPAAVLLSPSAYDELTERARFVAAEDEGLADVEAGRVHTQAEAEQLISSRFGKPK